MKLSRKSPEWQSIIAENKVWFSPETMKFFGSVVFWQTLTSTDKGKVFITSENCGTDESLFSIRIATDKGIDTLGEFQQYKSLAEALEALRAI